MKITAPQERTLRRIVKTNGGGVFVECAPDRQVIMRLHEKGLVQGKASQLSWAVHTRDGLELIRELDATRSVNDDEKAK